MNQPQKLISILAALRAVVPQRPLRYAEAERIAELQANRLRELLRLDEPKLPEQAISELPRIVVRRSFNGLASSGAHAWDGSQWVIALNPAEPLVRQRFSLCHEFKHVLDHTLMDFLYPTDRHERAEQMAEYFAGCLLMPKRHVKRLFGEGFDPATMARMFGVSARAMNVRLLQLGLIEPNPRCDRRDVTEKLYSATEVAA